MSERTGIAWADSTFNPWLGCARVSAGCDFCYAEAGSKRFAAQHGLKLWDGDRHVTSAAYWREPLKWNRQTQGEPWRVFCGSWCDWAEDHPVADATRPRLFALVEATTNLTWMLLTKRPECLREILPPSWLASPRPNVWLGTTCEDQRRLDERAPALLDVPAVVHFLSCEPLLEGVTLRGYRPEWVIVGGESGPKARPFAQTWAYRLLDECRERGSVPFVKQMGSVWARGRDATTHPHGADPSEWALELRVQRFPGAALNTNTTKETT